jgi:hypothetical protein
VPGRAKEGSRRPGALAIPLGELVGLGQKIRRFSVSGVVDLGGCKIRGMQARPGALRAPLKP